MFPRGRVSGGRGLSVIVLVTPEERDNGRRAVVR